MNLCAKKFQKMRKRMTDTYYTVIPYVVLGTGIEPVRASLPTGF